MLATYPAPGPQGGLSGSVSARLTETAGQSARTTPIRHADTAPDGVLPQGAVVVFVLIFGAIVSASGLITTALMLV